MTPYEIPLGVQLAQGEFRTLGFARLLRCTSQNFGSKAVGFAKQMEAFSRQDSLELLAFGKLAQDDSLGIF